MTEAMGDGLEVPTELVPRCPHCGAEAFPWVRGYGNFLQGELYEEQYRKVSDWLEAHARQRILFLELGVGRMTPAFIQEPFWTLTAQLPQASYIAVNNKTQFLPRAIEDRGMSSAAGFNHYNRAGMARARMANWQQAFGFKSLFDGFYHLYPSLEQQWAYYARCIDFMLREPASQPYLDLRSLIGHKDYLILSTNVDTQVEKTFPAERTCNYQGNFAYLQ